MSKAYVKNEGYYEKQKSDFVFISNFDAIHSLVVKYCQKNKLTYVEMLETASFGLTAGHHFDFGEDHPTVAIDLYVDDDQYLTLLGDNQTENAIKNIFEKVIPSNMFVGLSVSLHPVSLSGDITQRSQWRNNPQYIFRDEIRSVDQATVEKIWSSTSSLHVFISHKVTIKERAHKLKK